MKKRSKKKEYFYVTELLGDLKVVSLGEQSDAIEAFKRANELIARGYEEIGIFTSNEMLDFMNQIKAEVK